MHRSAKICHYCTYKLSSVCLVTSIPLSFLKSKDNTCYILLLYWSLVQWCATLAQTMITRGIILCFVDKTWHAARFCTLVSLSILWCRMKKINVLCAVVPYLVEALPGLEPRALGHLQWGIRMQLKEAFYLWSCFLLPTQVFVRSTCERDWLSWNQSGVSKEVPVFNEESCGEGMGGCGAKKNVWCDPDDNYLCFGGARWREGACCGRQINGVG